MDSLVSLINTLRGELPEVSPDVWSSILRLSSQHYGGTRIYVQAAPKRAALDILDAARPEEDIASLARKTGLTPRRIQQLRKLRRG